MSLEIRIDKNAFGAVGPLVQKKVGQIVRKTASDVEANAKAVVVVDTGALKASIQARAVGPLTSEIQVGQEYGSHIEFGTTRMAARPYLTPSVDAARQPFERAVGAAVRAAADEASDAG